MIDVSKCTLRHQLMHTALTIVELLAWIPVKTRCQLIPGVNKS